MTEQNGGWFYRPKVIRGILRGFYLCCVALLLADLLVHRHISTPLERILAFYPVYGFVACVLLVLLARGLRRLLMRPEDYYVDDKHVDS